MAKEQFAIEAVAARVNAKAGRNLAAAVGVAVAILAAVLIMLFTKQVLFVYFVSIVAAWAQKEVAEALTRANFAVPLPPLMVGGFGILICAYYLGLEAMLTAFFLTVAAAFLWRLADETPLRLRDMMGATFIAAYVPFLIGFGMLILAEHGQPWPLLTTIVLIVCSDTAGLAVGVWLGKHPIAPSISPKKSWEGLAGSVTVSAVAGTICFFFMGGPMWAGGLMGMTTAVTATVGDFAESLLKRDLGLKDMGSLLPGHGGVMDRLDSIVVTAPVAYLILRSTFEAGML